MNKPVFCKECKHFAIRASFWCSNKKHTKIIETFFGTYPVNGDDSCTNKYCSCEDYEKKEEPKPKKWWQR